MISKFFIENTVIKLLGVGRRARRDGKIKYALPPPPRKYPSPEFNVNPVLLLKIKIIPGSKY